MGKYKPHGIGKLTADALSIILRMVKAGRVKNIEGYVHQVYPTPLLREESSKGTDLNIWLEICMSSLCIKGIGNVIATVKRTTTVEVMYPLTFFHL